MKLGHETVEHVARLARLRLTEGERERMAEALSAVLAHMASLGDVEGGAAVPDGVRGSGLSDLRSDVPRPLDSVGGLLELAPEIRDRQFVVPRIVAEP